MANEKTLNTIIQLRQGTTAEWESSKLILKKGEMGLEYLSDGTVKIKAGDGVHPFFDQEINGENLSGLPYVGSDVKDAQVFQMTTPEAYDSTKTDNELIAELVSGAELQAGDVAIIKRYIAKDDTTKISYTSYVYENSVWEAMDGNYSADNVYFKDDITLAGSYTTIGNVNINDGTLSAKGKSLSALMQSIFTKELWPSKSIPTLKLEITANNDDSGEVGSTYKLPSAKVTVTGVGSYTYGPATGIKFTTGNLTLSCSGPTGNASVSNTTDLGKDGYITLAAPTSSDSTFELIYKDTAEIYAFTASGTYTAGVTPVTNLGNPCDSDYKISSDTITITASQDDNRGNVKRTGYRKIFAGGTTVTLNSETIRGFSYSAKSRPTSEATALYFNAAKGATKVVCAYPSTWSGTPYVEMFGLAWGQNSDFSVKSETVQVADARGTIDGVLSNPKAYKICSWELDTPLAAAETQFRMWFK